MAISNPTRPSQLATLLAALAGLGYTRCGCGEVATQPPRGSQERHPAWLPGTPSVQGMLSSLMLLKPGYNYLLQADTRDRFPTWISPNTFIPSSLVCREHAYLQSCVLTIPSLWNATSACLSRCCHSFQLRSQSPRTIQPWEAPCSRVSQHLLSVSITHSVLGMDCLVCGHSASCQYLISPARFGKMLYIVKVIM